MHILLGRPVVDRITGFRGIVTGHVEYLTGCNQALVVPKTDKDGKLQDGQWFDDQRLQLDPNGESVLLDNGSTPGHDRAPPRNY